MWTLRRERFAGAYSGEVTPVPIPNTVVKLFTPMVLATTERVGSARLKWSRQAWTTSLAAFFFGPDVRAACFGGCSTSGADGFASVG